MRRHDAHGQTSLWDKSQLRSWHLQSIDAAADAKAALEYEERAALAKSTGVEVWEIRSRRRRPSRPPAGTRYGYRGHDEHADVCVGEGHTCALWRAPPTGSLPCKSGTK